MKYLVALLLGILTGVVLFAAVLYYNPFVGQPTVSTIAVSESNLMALTYSAVPEESLVFTNDGESIASSYPDHVQDLWEPTIRNSQAMVALLTDGLGEPIGIGIKVSSVSEDSRLLHAEILVDSVWQVYLPGRGSLFIDQTENYWTYLHDIVIPASWSSADHWRGSWHNVMTVGPHPLGTARVTGASGQFAGLETEGIESITARAFSSNKGPVSMTGNVTVSLPNVTASQ